MMKKHYLSLRPFIRWQAKEHPINWVEVFGREAPLEVEIGFGNGEFLVRQALAQSEMNFLGMELEWGSIRRALRQIEKEGLENVRLMQTDTRFAFERLFLPMSLHRAYSLFPMPWPKERHQKHRLFSHSFLRLLNSRMISEGEVQIVTDYEPYFNWIIKQLPGTGFEVNSKLTLPIFGTKYERKWQEKGQKKFFEINLVKKEHLEITLKEDITLRTYSIKHFDPEHFNPPNEWGEIVVEFKEFIYDPKRKKGMVRVLVVEDNLKQNFWIEVKYGEEAWHIKLARSCEVLPTVGVQRALDLVYDATSNS